MPGLHTGLLLRRGLAVGLAAGAVVVLASALSPAPGASPPALPGVARVVATTRSGPLVEVQLSAVPGGVRSEVALATGAVLTAGGRPVGPAALQPGSTWRFFYDAAARLDRGELLRRF